ncbi:MAG: hypothetical protein U0840_06850 [Gemmataceae bacterium]
MSCRVGEKLLQEHLDGTGSAATLASHLESCSACAADQGAIRKLLRGLTLLTPPCPPPDLTDRIVLAVQAQPGTRLASKRPHYEVWALIALAASLILAVAAWRFSVTTPGSSNDPKQNKTFTPMAEAPAPPAPLRESVEEARAAVVALTTRTAEETLETTAGLFPPMDARPLDPMPTLPASLEPPLESLMEAGTTVGTTVAPVADSARRAVGLFMRDLPLARLTASGKRPG